MSHLYRAVVILVVVFYSTYAQPLETFSRLTDVRAMSGSGDTLWAATSGGLVLYDIVKNETVAVVHDNEIFPDISLTSAALQGDGTLWIGSSVGFLYARNTQANFTTFTDFFSSGARIKRLYLTDSLLLVVHTKGLSLFDTEKGSVLFSLSSVATMGNVVGEDVLVSGDSLYFTWSTSEGDRGVALFDSVSQNMNSVKFTDPSQWAEGITAVTSVDSGMMRLVEELDGSLYAFPGPVIKRGSLFWYGKGDSVKVIDATLLDSASGAVKNLSGGIYTSYDNVQAFAELRNRIFVGQVSGGISELSLSEDTVLFSQQNLGGIQEHHPRHVHHTSQGDVWVLPYTDFRGYYDTINGGLNDTSSAWTHWNSVTRFRGSAFSSYNSLTTGFGTLGDNVNFSGFAEGATGNIYLGSNGSSLKVFNGTTWSRWKFDRVSRTQPILVTDGSGGWTKVDGVTKDAANNLWLTNFHFFGSEDDIAAFLVMSEDGQSYKYLFDLPSEMHPPFSLTVDSKGNILALFASTPYPVAYSNNWFLLDGRENPYTASESALLADSGRHTSRNSLISASATTLGSIIVGTDAGVDVFRYGTEGSFSTLKNYPSGYAKTVSCVAVQQSREIPQTLQGVRRFETVLWAAVKGIGPIQMRIIEEVDANSDNLIDAYYDTTFTPKILTAADGLPYRDVIPEYSLSLDIGNKTLWITDGLGGLTRYGIQFQPTTVESNEGVRAYPNPYSHQHHRRVRIDHVAPGGFVDIYTSNGTLVYHADQNSGDLIDEGELEWIYQWRVPKGIAPGVYFVTAKRGTNTTSLDRKGTFVRKLIITP